MGPIDYAIIILFSLSLIGSLVYLFWDIYVVHGVRGVIANLFSWEERIKIDIGIDSGIWNMLSKEEKNLFKNIYFNAKSNDVKFKISNNEKIEYPSLNKTGMMVSGYFCGDEFGYQPTLGLAVGGHKHDWLLVLLHESCHMDQWLGKSSIWSNGQIAGKDVYDLLDEWINGKELNNWEVEKVIKSCIDIELDCEKRTIEKIRENELMNIDKVEYVQKANSYVMFYGVILKKRKWYVRAPYLEKNVWMRMPKAFLEKNQYFDVKQEYVDLYDQYCFNE
jgi:hypothetical protein